MAATSGLPRIDVLAHPKRLPLEYKDDRRSVYWVEKEPLRTGPDGHTVFIATPRVSDLARHKTCVGSWQPHRVVPFFKNVYLDRRSKAHVIASLDKPSPMWNVSRNAMSASASARLTQLSEHKNPHGHYSFDRSPEWDIRKGALGASASDRIGQLSMPKRREETYSSFDPYWGFRQPIPENALRARPTERVEYLSHHKDYHKDFKNEKSVQWEVSEEAIAAIASLRLQQLARPRSRTMIKDDYDPYKVAPSARKTRSTPRIDELCMPIPRKVRQKMI